jgi:hypothetical protein
LCWFRGGRRGYLGPDGMEALTLAHQTEIEATSVARAVSVCSQGFGDVELVADGSSESRLGRRVVLAIDRGRARSAVAVVTSPEPGNRPRARQHLPPRRALSRAFVCSWARGVQPNSRAENAGQARALAVELTDGPSEHSADASVESRRTTSRALVGRRRRLRAGDRSDEDPARA